MQAYCNSSSKKCWIYNFFNYKGSHSIVLLAVCDALYRQAIYMYISITLSLYIVHMLTLCFNRFIIVEIGDAGRQSDAGVLSNSEFGQALENDTLTIPNPTPLAGVPESDYPFVIVGD